MIKKNNTKKFNISNKIAYILIAIFSFILIGVGVYAYGGSSPSTMGHSVGEIALPSCSSSGQALTWNGNSWVCAFPSGTDMRLTVNANGVCFTSPEKCEYSLMNCYNTQYLEPIDYGSDCGNVEQTSIDEMCYEYCSQLGPACDGQDITNNCYGGGQAWWTASGYCYSQYYIQCTCSSNNPYNVATYVPAGTRCL